MISIMKGVGVRNWNYTLPSLLSQKKLNLRTSGMLVKEGDIISPYLNLKFTHFIHGPVREYK